MAARPQPPLCLSESPPDGIIEDILLRLPPDEPACLLRASLVCKLWRRIISHRRFRRRLHELHRRPRVLGFLRNNNRMGIEDFVPTTASAFSLAVPDIGDLTALDCRHGRALLVKMDMDMARGSGELVLWDPITGDQESVPVPDLMGESQGEYPTAAIVCAAAGCDHCGCHGRRPFRLVMVYSSSGYLGDYEDCDEEDLVWAFDTWACSYSSETGEWGEPSQIEDFGMQFRRHTTSVLVGDSLLYFMADHREIIEYDLAGSDATIISPALEFNWNNEASLILTEDGGLGVAEPSSDSSLNIWSRVVVSDGNDAAIWVKLRVISLGNLLPPATIGVGDLWWWWPMSFAEGANVLFIRTHVGIFTIELQSEQVRKVCEDNDFCSLVPIEGFYTPLASQGEEA